MTKDYFLASSCEIMSLNKLQFFQPSNCIIPRTSSTFVRLFNYFCELGSPIQLSLDTSFATWVESSLVSRRNTI